MACSRMESDLVIVSNGTSIKTQTETHLTALDYTVLPLMPNEKLLAAVEGDKGWLPFGSQRNLLDCVNFWRIGCFLTPVSNICSKDACYWCWPWLPVSS